MNSKSYLLSRAVLVLLTGLLWALPAMSSGIDWMAGSVATLETELVAQHGEAQRQRVRQGLDQVADFWRAEDGGKADFEGFVRRNFAGDEEAFEVMFARFEKLLEKLDGHSLEILLAFREQSDLDLGPIMPYDEIFAAYDPFAHISDDFFARPGSAPVCGPGTIHPVYVAGNGATAPTTEVHS